jgi:hypothetical protein
MENSYKIICIGEDAKPIPSNGYQLMGMWGHEGFFVQE